MKRSKKTTLRSQDPPEPLKEEDLLKDLRDLIVTEESETLKTVLAVLQDIQRKINDPKALKDLLRPILPDLLSEVVKKDPSLFRSIFSEALREQPKASEEAARTSALSRLSGLLHPFALKIKGFFRKQPLFGKGQVSGQVSGQEELSALLSPSGEIVDESFKLQELFLLAFPSLVMLGHGSYFAPVQRSGEHVLSQIRRFLEGRKHRAELGTQLRARIGSGFLHIELGNNSLLAVVYRGEPPCGFFLDLRQTLSDIENSCLEDLRKAHVTARYRPALRLLLDRYRPFEFSQREKIAQDPINWPPPETL